MALHKSYIDTADLSVIEPAVRYYSRHGSDWEKMKTLHQLGIIQMNGGDYQSAVISLSDAARYIDRTEDWFNGGLICISLFRLYNKLHDDNESLLNAVLAEDYFNKAETPIYVDDAKIRRAIALNNLGRYKEAVEIYREVLNSEYLDSNNKYSAMAHLAHTQMSRQYMNPKEADSLFTAVLKSTGRLPYRQNWGAYAYASDLVGNKARADRIYAQLDTNSKDIFDWYSRSLYARGEYRNAFDHLVLSIAGQTEMLNVALTQAAHKAQRDHAELLRIESEHQARIQRIRYLTGSLFLLLLGLAVFLVARHRYRQSREDNLRLAETADKLVRQLKTAETEQEGKLAEIRQSYLRMNQASFREIGELYESLIIAGRNAHPQQAVWARVRKLTEEITGDKGSIRLEQMIDGAMNGLMKQFRNDFPDLREQDYKLMSFVIAGFDMSTLSIFFNKRSISVPYTRKHRLKRKIESASPEIRDRYLPYF